MNDVVGGGHRKSHGQPPKGGRKERDNEDLILFREMNKKEKDRIVSLLQPVSDEFEANGNYPLYRMASAKKGLGSEFLGDTGKNDYDWLKTPPATPLFPSLEMEATNAQELVIQREIPIVLPISRFCTEKSVVATNKSSIGRSKTPGQRPSVNSSLQNKANTKSKPMLSDQKINQFMSSTNYLISRRANAALTVAKAESPDLNCLASNFSKSKMGTSDSKPKPRPSSRGVVRPTIPAQIPGFSDQTPPNLRTDRSSSASRGRLGNQTTRVDAANNNFSRTPEPTPTKATRRLSCSPSVTRGRKVETTNTKQESKTNEISFHETMHKGNKKQLGGANGTQILGSRMVDKFMNARKSATGGEERETKSKFPLRGSINESSGFGRKVMPKSSLDISLKHLDAKRDGSGDFHQSNRSYSTIKGSPSS